MNTDPEAETIFLQAQQMPAGERSEFLRTVCADRETLRRHIEALLAADREAGEFLPDTPGNAVTEFGLNQETSGAVIGRYKLLQKLGEGGMGTVWMAEQREPVVRRVALKIIKLGMDTHEVVARFEQERQALAMMDHAAIAKVLDAGSTDAGRPYFVMELVRGVSVTTYCDEQKLGVPERLGIFMQICQAIQHAHQKGIIHRDIKPSNILVAAGDDGEPLPKVIDFGIAKATGAALTDKTLFTQLEQIIGTPAYMSPEQAGLGPLDIDTRSDVYALGVLLYELLTGRPPFDPRELMKAGLDEMRRVIREDEPPRPSTRISSLTAEELSGTATRRHIEPPKLASSLRGDLDWIVMKALEKNRNRRYETASGLAADIQRFLSDEPITARAPGAVYLISKFVRRHKLAFVAGSAVAFALVSGITAAVWGYFSAEAGREKAETASHIAGIERNKTAELLSVAQAERGIQLLGDKDPTGLLHLVEARRTVEQLPALREARTILWHSWLRELPDHKVITLDSAQQARVAAFSPDGRRLAVGSTTNEVNIHDVSDGSLHATLTTKKDPVFTVSFSNRGNYLLVRGGSRDELWECGPGAPVKRLSDWTGGDAQCGMSQNGRWLAAIFDGALMMMDLETGERRKLPDSATTREGSDSIVLPTDDGRGLFFSGMKSLRFVDLSLPEAPVKILNAGERKFTQLLLATADGRKVYEQQILGKTSLYDVAAGARLDSVLPPHHLPGFPQLTPGGKRLIFGRQEGLSIVDMETGHPVNSWLRALRKSFITSFACSTYPPLLAIGTRSGTVDFWDWLEDTRGSNIPWLQVREPAAVEFVALSSDGNYLATVGDDGRVRLHRLDMDEQAQHYGKQYAGVSAVQSITNDGRLLVKVASDDSLHWLVPGQPGEALPSLSVPVTGALQAAAISKTGEPAAVLVTAPSAGERRLFLKGAHSNAWGGDYPAGKTSHLALSPDETLLASLEEDGTVRLWEMGSGKPRARMPLPQPKQMPWTRLRWSPDSRWLAAETAFGSLALWDVSEQKALAVEPKKFVTAISDDWRAALISGELVDFSNPHDPRPVRSFSGRLAALSGDGSRAVIGSASQQLQVIDTESGRSVGRPIRTMAALNGVTFSPDGNLLVTTEQEPGAGDEGRSVTIRFWEASSGLPCGQPQETSGSLMKGLHFPAHRRILMFESTSADRKQYFLQSWELPRAEISLAEMERQSWTLARGRLTEAGVQPFSAIELQEMAKSPVLPAQSTTRAADVLRDPAAAPEKRFAAAKELGTQGATSLPVLTEVLFAEIDLCLAVQKARYKEGKDFGYAQDKGAGLRRLLNEGIIAAAGREPRGRALAACITHWHAQNSWLSLSELETPGDKLDSLTPQLTELMRDERTQIRTAAMWLLLRCTSLPAGITDQAFKSFGDYPPAERLAAANVLLQAGQHTEEVVTELERLAEKGDAATARTAISLLPLEGLHLKRTLAFLHTLLANPQMADAALMTLCWKTPPQESPRQKLLSVLMRHPAFTSRSHMAQAFENIPPGGLQPVLNGLADTDVAVRRRAAALLYCGLLRERPEELNWKRTRNWLNPLGPSVIPFLTQRLTDADEEVRCRAACILEAFGKDAASAAPALVPLLNDSSRYVRWAVAWTMEQIAPQLSVNERQKAVADRPAIVGPKGDSLTLIGFDPPVLPATLRAGDFFSIRIRYVLKSIENASVFAHAFEPGSQPFGNSGSPTYTDRTGEARPWILLSESGTMDKVQLKLASAPRQDEILELVIDAPVKWTAPASKSE